MRQNAQDHAYLKSYNQEMRNATAAASFTMNHPELEPLQQTITFDIHQKLREQIERTEHLIRMIPAGELGWKPQAPTASLDLSHLLGHLLDCLAGFCAVFRAAFPRELAHLAELQSSEVNHACPPHEALGRFRQYSAHIDRGFALCSDDDLRRSIPSVFVPDGESVMTLLLGNLEHLINHKYQLFFYLKLAGLPVSSKDLYQWRGTPVAQP